MQVHTYALARRAQLRAEFRRYGISPLREPITDLIACLPSRSPRLVPLGTMEVRATRQLNPRTSE